MARRLAALPSEEAALARLPRLVHEALLTAFAPQQVREVVDDALRRAAGGAPMVIDEAAPTEALTIEATAEHLTVGGITVAKRRPTRPELVPYPFPYHDNPQHTRLLARLCQDYRSGERAILLVGNQVCV